MSDVVLPPNGSNVDGENIKGNTMAGTFSHACRTGQRQYVTTAVRLVAGIILIVSVKIN